MSCEYDVVVSFLFVLICTLIHRGVVSSAALDFLWACLQAPSLWQGKVKKEALIDSSLSMVSLLVYLMVKST